jgi:polyphosphate glucokinase
VSPRSARTRRPHTLALDIGGTGIKAAVLDARGGLIAPRLRELTPRPATPAAVLRVVRRLVAAGPPFERVAIGFPGVVEKGTIYTAVNLHPAWCGINLARRMERLTGRPTRVANDADVQGMAVVEGVGVELVLTLGTGMGSALFLDGWLVPNLQLGHHPFRKGHTYEDVIGENGLKRSGKRVWNKRLRVAIETLRDAFSFRRLYLGGGNARLVARPLPPRTRVVGNIAGVLGGIELWRQPAGPPRRRAGR